MFVFLFTVKRAKKEYYKDLDLHVVLTQEVWKNNKNSIWKQSQNM